MEEIKVLRRVFILHTSLNMKKKIRLRIKIDELLKLPKMEKEQTVTSGGSNDKSIILTGSPVALLIWTTFLILAQNSGLK